MKVPLACSPTFMPNWCLNVLRVHGDPGDCAEFRILARGASPGYVDDGPLPGTPPLPLSFHALVPVPDEVLAEGYDAAGYDWQCEHWGTKWELNHDVRVEETSAGGVEYAFETAWSPPEPWFAQVVEAFPWLSLELLYFEPGMLFCGHLRAEGGRVVEWWECADDGGAMAAFALEHFGWDLNEGTEDD